MGSRCRWSRIGGFAIDYCYYVELSRRQRATDLPIVFFFQASHVTHIVMFAMMMTAQANITHPRVLGEMGAAVEISLLSKIWLDVVEEHVLGYGQKNSTGKFRVSTGLPSETSGIVEGGR